MTSRVTYDRAALAAHGANAISKGSKSFGLAALLFGRDMREDVHMLYAWCRYCDDVIDGQTLGGDAPDGNVDRIEQERRLAILKELTEGALADESTGNPAFDGFGEVARRHDLPAAYPKDLLAGFARDVAGERYVTLADTLSYCYGVAGVVGVMMAIIMGVDKEEHETLDRACDLGLAFQLTNICRDVVDDARGGRIYLPEDWLAAEGIEADCSAVLDPKNREALARVVARVLAEADLYYRSASEGARRLGPRAAAAILAARNVYRSIGMLVIARGSAAWDERALVTTPRKIWLAAAGAFVGTLQRPLFGSRAFSPRGDLWARQRPGPD